MNDNYINKNKESVKSVVYKLYNDIKNTYPNIENCNGSNYLTKRDRELMESYTISNLKIYFETILYRVYENVNLNGIIDYSDVEQEFYSVVESLYLTGIHNELNDLQVDTYDKFSNSFSNNYNLSF